MTWKIETTPSGAKIVHAATQQELGQTPWQAVRLASVGSLSLRIRLPGYVDQDVSLNQETDTLISKDLHKLPDPILVPVTPILPHPIAPDRPESNPQKRPKSGQKRGSGPKASSQPGTQTNSLPQGDKPVPPTPKDPASPGAQHDEDPIHDEN